MNVKVLQVCLVFWEHVVDANFYQLLLFVLSITIEGGIFEPSNKMKEPFGRLLFQIVKGDDGDLILTMEILSAETFHHILPCGNGIRLKSRIPCISTISE